MLTCYTDGSALTNPGPGGRAWVCIDQSHSITNQGSGGVAHATNNQMELMAVINFLETYGGGAHVDQGMGLFGDIKLGNQSKILVSTSIVVITDSTYVQQGVTQWLETRVRRDWRRSKGGKKIANIDLRIRLHRLIQRYTSLKRQRTKAHVGTKRNEWVDDTARREAMKWK